MTLISGRNREKACLGLSHPVNIRVDPGALKGYGRQVSVEKIDYARLFLAILRPEKRRFSDPFAVFSRQDFPRNAPALRKSSLSPPAIEFIPSYGGP
jgi:hypothetical protein